MGGMIFKSFPPIFYEIINNTYYINLLIMHISLTPFSYFSYFIYSIGITLMAFNIIGAYNIMSDRIKTLHLQSIEVLAYLILLPICLYKP